MSDNFVWLKFKLHKLIIYSLLIKDQPLHKTDLIYKSIYCNSCWNSSVCYYFVLSLVHILIYVKEDAILLCIFFINR